MSLDWSSFLSGTAVGTGAFWVWKAVTGYFRVNLSQQIELRRTPGGSPGTDDLVVLIKLKKGDRATLALEAVKVWLFEGERNLDDPTLLEQEPAWIIRPVICRRPLNLTPGEETHFAFHRTVSDKALYLAVARIEGKSMLVKCWPQAGWIASQVSVPGEKEMKKLTGRGDR